MTRLRVADLLLFNAAASAIFLLSTSHYSNKATLIARILYAAPAWWGFLNAAEKDRIESVINKAQRYGYLPSNFENVHSLVDNMESKLFNCILSNPRHVLYQLLPPEKDTGYNLRQRSHHLTLPFTDNNMIRKNFLHRMLFMDTY